MLANVAPVREAVAANAAVLEEILGIPNHVRRIRNTNSNSSQQTSTKRPSVQRPFASYVTLIILYPNLLLLGTH